MNYVNDLIDFLNESPCNFFAVEAAVRRLEAAGFKRLDMRDEWHLAAGDRRYIVKNSSAVFAFVVGTGSASDGWRIISAHSDSPCFRVKPDPEVLCDGRILKLNTEVYGGPILYTWFDRPLSLAGRVILRGADALHPETRLVRWDEALLTIPHLAIHYNRGVNEGNPLSKQKDMLPVLGRLGEGESKEGYVTRMVADKLGVDAADILDYDLMLYDTTPASVVGRNGEFITSGRIDDLMMAYAGISAIIASAGEPCAQTRVTAIFDNEETGSGTKQGAASPVLHNLLRRIGSALGGDDSAFIRAIDNSFMVSADNAHATHPNYVEKQDPTNHPVVNGGPVIKVNANCKYMTDADSAAVFRTICDQAGVPVQYFVNHSDVAGGSTLGNILTSQIDLRGVDMGAPQWAMHSCRETAGTADVGYTIAAFSKFFTL